MRYSLRSKRARDSAGLASSFLLFPALALAMVAYMANEFGKVTTLKSIYVEGLAI